MHDWNGENTQLNENLFGTEWVNYDTVTVCKQQWYSLF